LIPPVLRHERGREAEILASSLALMVLAKGWQLIVTFEAGATAVTRLAGIDLFQGGS
jgi:hypothetical protein